MRSRFRKGRAWANLLALVLASGFLFPLPAQKSVTREFIFHTAPFPSCHASTLVETRDGDFLAAWFGGSAEGASDVAIWGARRHHGVWGAPFRLVREANVPTWNPVLFYAKDGRLWLYYKFGPSARTWTGARIFSDDDGHTWSRPEHLPAGLLGPIKDKPLVLRDGTIIAGSSVESYSSWAVWMERSVDHGRTWSVTGPMTVPPGHAEEPSQGKEEVFGIIQPAVVSLGDGRLRFYARSTSNIGRICVADSYDEGRSWSVARPLEMVNPNSGIDAVGLRDGRIVLVLNHSATERTPLNLAVSRDGEHFRIFLTLEDAPGEYSYPAIIQDRDGNLSLTYTWNRKRIVFAQVPLTSVP